MADALSVSTEKVRCLFETSADSIVTCDLSGVITDVNPAFCEMLGYEKGHLVGTNYREITHPDSIKDEQDKIARAVERKMEFARYEKRYVTKAGRPLPVDLTAWVSRNSQGRAVGHVAIARDITETKKREMDLKRANEAIEREVAKRTSQLKQANNRLKNEIAERKAFQKALEKSDSQYKSLLASIKDVVFTTDMDGVTVYVNPSVLEVLGYSPEEFTGRPIFEYILEEEQDEAMMDFARVFSRPGEEKEWRFLSKSGDIIWMRCSAAPIYDQAQPDGICCIMKNITKSKMLHRELFRSERMAAAGQLAFMLADEINSNLENLESGLNAFSTRKHEAVHDLEITDACAAIRRAAEKLLELEAPFEEKRKAVNINQCIESAAGLLKERFKRRCISLDMRLSSRIPYTMASPKRLEHAFINLLSFACDSIVNGNIGAAPNSSAVKIRTRLKAGVMIIQISDTGNGWEKTRMNNLFEPFHAGEPNNKRRGLYISGRIIKEHQGLIKADNSPEGGGSFTISIPVQRIEAV